ncbi:hypothetical protein HN011_011974 [Eciton burchellii]|nr:hypothetical protein HN011_011974 [Eciton burchellii]
MKMTSRSNKKTKRLSRKKRTIKNYKIKQRKKWKSKEIHFGLDTIDTIDIKALKISENREVDIDYVKGMSAISLYGHNYRDLIQEDIFEEVSIRFNIIHKLSNLDINNKGEESCNVHISQQNIGFDIIQSTSCLFIKDN